MTESDIITITNTWAWNGANTDILWYFQEYQENIPLLAHYFKQAFCQMVDEMAASFKEGN